VLPRSVSAKQPTSCVRSASLCKLSAMDEVAKVVASITTSVLAAASWTPDLPGYRFSYQNGLHGRVVFVII